MAAKQEEYVQELTDGFEFSIHACPKKYRSEILALFPGVNIEELLVVPTCQRSKMDLVNTGDPVEKEKDYCLEKFFAFSKAVCKTLSEKNFWCDYIDPCSGLPMIHQDTTMVYNEVDALSTLLGYQLQNAGCCKVVFHPTWGSSIYPSTLFAIAPKEELILAIQNAKDTVENFSL